jgi:hypothetical protein
VRIDNNIGDFRSMARRRLPGPIFHYIDGAADDEVTYRRNAEAYERCDLVPNVLAGVESIDMSTTVMGQKIDMPLFCSPTALQRLFHHDGERAVAKLFKGVLDWIIGSNLFGGRPLWSLCRQRARGASAMFIVAPAMNPSSKCLNSPNALSACSHRDNISGSAVALLSWLA